MSQQELEQFTKHKNSDQQSEPSPKERFGIVSKGKKEEADNTKEQQKQQQASPHDAKQDLPGVLRDTQERSQVCLCNLRCRVVILSPGDVRLAALT